MKLAVLALLLPSALAAVKKTAANALLSMWLLDPPGQASSSSSKPCAWGLDAQPLGGHQFAVGAAHATQAEGEAEIVL